MSEAELHVLRARLNGGIRNKAARGELRRGLPVGFVWGEADGEVRFHPDEAIVAAIRNVFARFAETGSARRVWLWFRSEGLTFPLQMHQNAEIRWVEASYTAIHHVLTNPVYAGAYAYGKSRRETMLDAAGARTKRVRQLPRSEWQVLIPDHHPGFIDWQTYEANQDRIANNIRPGPHKVGGAVREGSALLQSLASCGHCGRRLHTHYRGRSSAPGYHCPGKILVEAAASIASTLAAFRSTRPSRGPSSPPSSRQSSLPRSPLPSGSKQIARPRSSNGVSASSGQATKRATPSAATVPSIQTTGWSLAAWSASGRRA